MQRELVPWLLTSVLGTGVFVSPARSAPQEAAEAPAPIIYQVQPQLTTENRRLKVTMTFSIADPHRPVRIQMPVWSPGDYHVMNHAKYVEMQGAVSAESNNSDMELRVTRADENTWEIQPEGVRKIAVTYLLPETPPGIFSENLQLRENRVFLNGPATYLYVVGRKDVPALVEIQPPTGWKVEVPLPVHTTVSSAFSFRAPDYDTLADSPVVMAAPDAIATREFTLNGIPHKAVYFGKTEIIKDFDAYTPVLKKVAAAEARIMGGVPYARYYFLFDVSGRGGGLEHLNCARMTLWGGGQPRFIAGFVAHEFFHLWNVKRIRPRVLGPFDYADPPRTRNLWFAEGVTEYYAGIATRRAGLQTEEATLQGWKRSIQQMQRNPARLRVSADESSLRVWEANNSSGYGGLSYYAKGELIGLCLDLKLRHVTQNRKSLDDVMRLLMARHHPPKPGYGEDGIREAVNEVAGQDLSDFYDLLARSTQEMPFTECLGYAGLDLDMKPLPDATPEQTELRKNWMAEFPDTEIKTK